MMQLAKAKPKLAKPLKPTDGTALHCCTPLRLVKPSVVAQFGLLRAFSGAWVERKTRSRPARKSLTILGLKTCVQPSTGCREVSGLDDPLYGRMEVSDSPELMKLNSPKNVSRCEGTYVIFTSNLSSSCR